MHLKLNEKFIHLNYDLAKRDEKKICHSQSQSAITPIKIHLIYDDIN